MIFLFKVFKFIKIPGPLYSIQYFFEKEYKFLYVERRIY